MPVTAAKKAHDAARCVPIGVEVGVVDRDAQTPALRVVKGPADDGRELGPGQSTGHGRVTCCIAGGELTTAEHVEIDVRPPRRCPPRQMLYGRSAQFIGPSVHLVGRVQPNAVGDGRRPETGAVALVALAEHHHRVRLDRRQVRTQRPDYVGAGQPQQQRNLHVGRLAIGRGRHRGRVLVRVEEQQPGAACFVTQCRNGPEENRAVPAVEQREAALGQRTADAAVDSVDHRDQRVLVEEPGWTSTRLRFRRRDVRGDHRARQSGRQPRLPQRRWRLSLAAATSRAVETHPDQINLIQAAEGHASSMAAARTRGGPCVTASSRWLLCRCARVSVPRLGANRAPARRTAR